MRTSPDAPETRKRILDAAVELVSGGKLLSMQALARAAGVSRQTIYLHFGDRKGLISSLLPHLADEQWGLRSVDAVLALPAREAFDRYFRLWIRFACRVGPYLRPLYATLGQDQDVTETVTTGDAILAGFYDAIFGKLEKEGLLRPQWTAREAADAAWSMTLYMLTAGHMRLIRGWRSEQIEAMQIKLLSAAFLKDEAA